MCIPTVGAGTPELDMAKFHMIAARSQKCAYTRREEYTVPVQYRTGVVVGILTTVMPRLQDVSRPYF